MKYKMLRQCPVLFSGKSRNSLRNFANIYKRAVKYSTSVQDAKPFKSIPGLSSLPLLGPIQHFLPIIGQFGPNASFTQMTGVFHKKYGPIVKMNGVFARADMVILFDPEDIDQVADNNKQSLVLSNYYNHILFTDIFEGRIKAVSKSRYDPLSLDMVYRSLETNPLRPGFQTVEYYREVLKKDTFEGVYGLTTAQGAQWRDFRTKVNPALLKIKLVRVYAPPLEEIAQDFVNRLKQLKDDKTYLTDNFDLELTKWSLESVAFVGLGSRLGCLTDELTPEHPASKLMKCAKDIMKYTFKLEFAPNPWRYIATPTFKKLMKSLDVQWDVSTMYIELARKRISERGHDIPEEDKSIIEKLLAIDERVAIMMGNEMLLAGIDTVAFTVTSLLYHLATNPEKQEKLRQEIRSEDPHKRYLRACLKETQRIWHVVPANLRRTDRDLVVRGYHIPAGVDVIAPNEYLSKLEKYYPQPNEFIPERWLADKTDPLYYGNAHPMVTLPFGFGVRSCIGRRIAELETEVLMKKVFDEFKVTWEGPPIKIVQTLMNAFDKPYNFRFESAK